MESTLFNDGWRTEHPHVLENFEHRFGDGFPSAPDRNLDLADRSNLTAKKSLTDSIAQSMDKVNSWFHNRKLKKKSNDPNDGLDQPAATSDGLQWRENYLDDPSINEPFFIDQSFYDLDFNFSDRPLGDVRRGSDSFDPSEHMIDMNPTHTPVRPNFQHAVGMLGDAGQMDEADVGHYAFFNPAASNQAGGVGIDPSNFAVHGKQFDRHDALPASITWPLAEVDTNHSTTSRSSITHSAAGDNSSSDLKRLEASGLGPAVSVQGSSTGRSLSSVPTPPGSSDQNHMQANWAPYPTLQDADPMVMQQNMYRQQQFSLQPHHNYDYDNSATAAHQLGAVNGPAQTILPSQKPQPSSNTPLKPGTPAENVNDKQTPSSEIEQRSTPNHGVAPEAGTSPSPPSGLEIKQPRAVSSLAARRQRRPAALGSAAMRNTSYAGGPASPKVPATAPIQGLRRIQSSTGVLNGRIQKSGINSAPRSPMNFAFADAGTSPKFPRSMSNNSLAAQLSNDDEVNMNKPLTPSSPQHPTGQVRLHHGGSDKIAYPMGIQWAESLSTQGVVSPTNAVPTSAMKDSAVVSPPATPMDHHQFAQMRLRTPSNPQMIPQAPAAPPLPQSAPAFQQTFHIPTYNPYAQHPPMPAMPGPYPVPHPMYASPPMQPQYGHPVYQQATPENNERPSVHGGMAGPVPFMQHPNLSAPVIQNPDGMHVQPRMHYQPSPHHPMPHMHPAQEGNYYMQQFPHPQYAAPPSHAVTPERQMEHGPITELQIHEYSPLEPVDSYKLPPKSMTPSGPKQYSFQNTGPEDYGRDF